jgi:hypothetical protein
MNTINRVVIGVFKTRAEVNKTVELLKLDGFQAAEFSMVQLGTGTVKIPGIGRVVATGPIVAALSDVGVHTALIDFGISEYEAIRYEGYLKDGNILFSVQVDKKERAQAATEILQKSGAVDISSNNEIKTPQRPFEGSDAHPNYI